MRNQHNIFFLKQHCIWNQIAYEPTKKRNIMSNHYHYKANSNTSTLKFQSQTINCIDQHFLNINYRTSHFQENSKWGFLLNQESSVSFSNESFTREINNHKWYDYMAFKPYFTVKVRVIIVLCRHLEHPLVWIHVCTKYHCGCYQNQLLVESHSMLNINQNLIYNMFKNIW